MMKTKLFTLVFAVVWPHGDTITRSDLFCTPDKGTETGSATTCDTVDHLKFLLPVKTEAILRLFKRAFGEILLILPCSSSQDAVSFTPPATRFSASFRL